MAAGSTTLHAVEKLQVRLATKTDPKKLGKYLQKLSALPVTADILAETRIRKTVKGLRKHQHVGPIARDLAARWKKLLLVDPNTRPGPDPRDREESSSRERFGEALRDQEKAWGFPENGTAPRSRSHSPEHRRTARTAPTGLRRPERSSPSRQDGAQRKRPRNASADSGPNRAPQSGRAGPLPMSEGLEPGQQTRRGHADTAQGLPLLAGGCQGQPQDEAVGGRRKKRKSSRREERPVGAQGRGQSPASLMETSSGACTRGESPRPSSRESPRDTAPSASAGTRKEGGRAGGSGQRLPAWAVAPDGHPERPRHRRSPKKRPGLDGPDPRKGTHGLSPGVKQQLSGEPETREGKPRTAHLDAVAVGSLSDVEEGEGAEEFQQPALSFEQYLTYDQPQKKAKKTAKSSGTARGDQRRRASRSKGTGESRASPPKLPPVKESHSPRPQAAGADSSGRKTVLSHGFSELWDLSEPWMQANYDLLSAFESLTAQTQTEPALSAPTFQEETGSPGRRKNAKMQVYSGSRPARQPGWLTLRQQCVRALRDNPGVLGRAGRVPSWVFELVLEGCTPDQLYRREKNNHALIGQTDGLWRIHCLRDFKGENPQEHESWRELYLRLRHAREQRLRVVTTNIRAARDNKPHGRRTKMICFNSVAEPPNGAPRRQEKSAGAADPENGNINPDPHPPKSSRPPPASEGGGAGSGLPRRPEKRAYACLSWSNARATPEAKIRKQAAKKVAPLMAKAIRDYKRAILRR
ncbi:elongin-A2-like [Saimiri boliviensis]|uniref:elongin-A2-like n=1 Tax=Saimiri boliviensis TaxID=27679 RepID=UPI003D78788A